MHRGGNGGAVVPAVGDGVKLSLFAGPMRPRESEVGEFIMNNLALVAIFLASGAMLAWPEISRMLSVARARA